MRRSVPHRAPIISQNLATLTVAPDGTLTIPRAFLDDLGLEPGDQVTLDDLFSEHLVLTPINMEDDR